jgi:hypothetical protein
MNFIYFIEGNVTEIAKKTFNEEVKIWFWILECTMAISRQGVCI